jgi:HIRAN domain
MSVDLNKRIDLTCPVCNKGFHQTLGWMVKHKEVICPHCESSYGISIADPEALGDQRVATLGSSFFTKIAGVTFLNKDRKSRQHLITKCHIGEELILERELDNPGDPKAIKVLRVSGEQLGYIPAQVAASLAKDLDRGERPRCRIVNLTGGNGLNRGVNIEIGEWPKDSHPSGTATPNEPAAFSYGWIIAVFAVVAAFVLFLIARDN